MFSFNKNHLILVLAAFAGFLFLSVLIAIAPAYQMEDVQPLPNDKPMTEQQRKGLQVFISEGCVSCHTQQVRNIAMDKTWGNRPSIPSDYYYSKKRLDIWRQSPSLLGSERTGPDLTNVGFRRPGKIWNLLHLYNPRSVVPQSIMPAFPWLFLEKDSTEIKDTDFIVPVNDRYIKNPGNKIIATQKILDLVTYLESLKQPEVPDEQKKDFIPFSKFNKKINPQKTTAGENMNSIISTDNKLDGKALFVNTCAPCHQQNGAGLKNAFPPLAGSPIVNDNDPTKMINIVLEGYDARAEYGVMPPFKDQLTDAQIAAIISYERSSWGNNASEISPEDVAKIRNLVSNNMIQ